MTKLFRHIAVLLIVGLLVMPAVPYADQAQYFYDDQGRLVGVADEAGNVALYNYDAVGNLLSIDRFTPAGSGVGIFLLRPAASGLGTQVEIRGFGFIPTPANNQATFSGTPATVVSATPTVLVVTVPAGATTGTVTVTNTNGTANSPQPFTVLIPTITGIDPARVGQGTITVAMISGVNLGQATAVTFSNSGLTGTLLSSPRPTPQSVPIRLTVVPSVPTGTYTFTVTTPNGVAQSGAVTLTVAPPAQAFTTPPAPLSVFKPFPPQVAPSGSAMTVAPPVSVLMP